MAFEKSDPPSPPASLKSFRTDSLPPVERSLTCQSRIPSPREFAFDWILKVVAVLSAILFGIWAPVSYRLQDLGNRSNDVSQTQLIEKIERMGQEVEGLKKQMERIASLRAWEFCTGEGGEKMPACRVMLKEGDVNALIADLSPKTRMTTTAELITATASPPKTIASRVASAIVTHISEDDGPRHDDFGIGLPVMTASASTPSHTVPPCVAHSNSTISCSIDRPLSVPSNSSGLRFDLLFLVVLLGGFLLAHALQMRRGRTGEAGRNITEKSDEELMMAINGKSDLQ